MVCGVAAYKSVFSSPSSQASGAEAGVPPLSSRASIETMSLGESGVSADPLQGLLQDGRVARLGKNRMCSNAALPGASHCRACKCDKHACDKRKSRREIYCAAHAQEQSKLTKMPVYEQMVGLRIGCRVAVEIADGSPTRLDVGKNESV